MSGHPQRTAIRDAVYGWYHDPFDDMGLRAEVGRWGTYWNVDNVFVSHLDAAEVPAFLADLERRYGGRPVRINFDRPEQAKAAITAVIGAGCEPLPDELYLALVPEDDGRHSAVDRAGELGDSATIEPIDAGNVRDAAGDGAHADQQG